MFKYQLHIAIRAKNGEIYEELGDTDSTVHIPSLYDKLATSLQAQLVAAGTKVDPQDPEPKITTVRTDTTYYESLEHFAEALRFI